MNPNESNVAKQRAALMGIVSAILMDEGEKSAREIKNAITSTLTYLIDSDAMVGDAIDMMTIQAAKQFCEQEIAVELANDILGNLGLN